jgi:hypothetical protein
MDATRALLNRYLFITIQGMTFPTWARVLWHNRGLVHPLYWPRAALLTLTSLLNTAYAALDLLIFGAFVRRARVQAPIIIIGHFRSGTTHLHNLMALDPQFAYPSLFQTMNPGGFLSTEWLFRLPTRLLLTSHRPQDNVALDPTVPAEDEVAVAIATGHSPYLGWVFPTHRQAHARFLTLEGLTPVERRRWRAGLVWFLKKLSWKYGRPLLLKSPPHTARLRELLELFPDARFVHIHRDPYEVFQSTRRLLAKLPPYFALQPDGRGDADERILTDYARMYDAYFAQKALIPDGQFCEVGFDELECDPVGTLGRVYRTLGLTGFDRVEPEARRYLDTIRDYRKNEHAPLPDPLRDEITRRWRQCFEAWGPPRPPAGPCCVPRGGGE